VTYLSVDGKSALYTKLLATLALTIALASVTYFAVEAPALRLKVRTGPGRRRTGVVPTAAATGGK
jgi:peptidoglycan/LPS O-acetylase OafA/YrhL